MDNPSRSERSRKAALTAALTIIARDGPGRLTLDAIARESGLSKGGLMHQFPNKEAVLKALLEQQFRHFDDFANDFRAKAGEAGGQPELATQIAISRELIAQQYSVAQAMLGALAQEPSLLADARAKDAERLAEIRGEAHDPDLAVLRWAAARGLALMALLRVSPLEASELDRLFERLRDNRQWPGVTADSRPSPEPAKY
ncbi:TetR/AcrR family transcriptional regulator [Bradyrhizobium sp. HKCCYLS3077]|uniref:TetR/AcrR family transcriptional regulator n=1 Tax=Bradyrhizobium sp. HKCCYLS3077 TaxID=3420761 RepID=UPI003EB6D6B6